jgi:TRAP-type mannitol/chloroaromatic compound transport system permease small subunit
MRGLCGHLGRGLGRALGLLKWLVLPVSLLLFLQWPLRELVQGYSREANDLGQWLFALYVAASVTAATQAGTHLAADALARRYRPRARRALSSIGSLAILLPWALFVAVSARPTIVSSVQHLERFADTGNPGYFIVKLALWLLTGLMLIAIALDFCPGSAQPATDPAADSATDPVAAGDHAETP